MSEACFVGMDASRTSIWFDDDDARESRVAREGSGLAECVRRGAAAYRHPLRQLAGIRNFDTQRSSGLSGRRAVPVGQRYPQGSAGICGGRALHGRPRSHAEESRNSSVLSAALSGRDDKEVAVDSVHAEAADDSQRHGQEWYVMASRYGTGLCRGIGNSDSTELVIPRPIVCDKFSWVNRKSLLLTAKAVADAIILPCHSETFSRVMALQSECLRSNPPPHGIG